MRNGISVIGTIHIERVNFVWKIDEDEGVKIFQKMIRHFWIASILVSEGKTVMKVNFLLLFIQYL